MYLTKLYLKLLAYKVILKVIPKVTQKKDNPEKVVDYRPISLSNVSYKAYVMSLCGPSKDNIYLSECLYPPERYSW